MHSAPFAFEVQLGSKPHATLTDHDQSTVSPPLPLSLLKGT